MSSLDKKHDVFLSFRGEDTRYNFTSHLREALSQRSIATFIDEQLPRGQDVWEAIARAIEVSRLSIVVFSQKYATSKWCLDELVKILECRENRNQIVIPVFYLVNPSDVRHQRGSYGNVFAKHEQDPGGKSTENVLRWKAALTDAANISGWHSRKDKDESLLIKDIVNDVRQKLHLRDPTELKSPIGDEENCRNVESLLKTHRVIGIWGMAGIGKSTIAEVLFAKLFPQYDHVCVVNAKQYWLNKLFSALSKEEVSPSNVDIVKLISHMRGLSSKKIFIVLDDVNTDSLHSFECLYREYDDQHPDSRLIITTRDEHLLEGRVDWIYEVKEWKNPKSLELFYLEAFNKSYPEKGYESLSARAVEYAGGVPLALKVLGSHFHRKPTEFWKSTLSELDNYPDEKIQKVLEVSYTGLHDLEKNIFIDIAFFFKEKERDHAIRILDACGFEATRRIKILAGKALLTISKSKIIQMHDLLQEMGLEIVRLQDKDDPGKRSRLKDNDAREVIQHNSGTDAIQGIALDLSQIENLPLRADTFSKMKTLRFLEFYNTLGHSSSNTYLNLPETLEPFSDELRYIEWIGYPFESLPSPFCAELLVEIHMPHSKVKQLWQGKQKLDNLERIQLSGCQQFEELPDLSKAPKLKWVNLSCCESLRYLHPSVLSSNTLANLILDGCTKLESVKGEKHLKSLREISVNGCLSLEEFAVSSDLIENLDLSNTGIQTLGTQIGRMHNLWRLNLEGLRLRHFVKELSWLTSLKELKLSDTWLVIDKEQLHVLFDGLRSLQILHMKDFSNLFELPDNISDLSILQELRLDGSNVKMLPEIENLEKLEILSLENCKELLCLPKLPSRIKNLGAINCESLVSVSNLNTLATKMWGMTKFITFKNSLELDGHSCKLIMESLHLTMMHAVFDNVVSRHHDAHGYNYTSVQLCLPGSRVPQQIKYQNTKSFITIELLELSNLLGFIYSVVLSPAGGMKKQGTKIKCKCHLPEEGMKEAWLDSDIGGLNSDHVYVWYDPFHCDSILKYCEPKVCFEFCVANDEGEVDDSIRIEECGIRLVTVSDVPSVLQELDWELDTKKNFVELLEKATDQRITFPSIEQFDEEESNVTRNQIDNQQRDLTEHIFDSIVGTESNTEMVELDSVEEDNVRKNHHPDVEESFKSTHKETETYSATDCRQNTRESKEKSRPKSAMDELESVEDNERKDHFCGAEESIGYTGKEIKIAAGSKESITEYTDPSSDTHENAQETLAKSEEVFHPKPSLKLHPEVVESSSSDTNTREKVEVDAKGTSSPLRSPSPIRVEEVANEPSLSTSLQASSKGGSEDLHNTLDESKQVVETEGTEKSVTKYSSSDLEDCLQQLNENPFAILDLLSRELSQPNDVTTVLNEFRNLVFSTSLLEKLPDQSYQQQIEESLQKLNTYRREMTKVQEEGLGKFIELYNKAVNISRDKMLTEDELAKVAWEKRDLYNKLQDSKLKVQLFDTTISTSKSQIQNLQGRQREIQEAIKRFQEENEAIEKESSKLDSLYSEQQAKKNQTLQSVKHISTSVVHTRKQWEELEEKRLSLASAYEDLKEPFQRMKTNPPF